MYLPYYPCSIVLTFVLTLSKPQACADAVNRARWLLAIQPFDESRLQGQLSEDSATHDGPAADISTSSLTPGRRRRQSHPARGRGCASLDMSDTWSAALTASGADGNSISPASPAAASAAQALRDLLECRRALAAHRGRASSSSTINAAAAASGSLASEQVLAFLLQSDTRVEDLAAVVRCRDALARRRAEALRLARTLVRVATAPETKAGMLRYVTCGGRDGCVLGNQSNHTYVFLYTQVHHAQPSVPHRLRRRQP